MMFQLDAAALRQGRGLQLSDLQYEICLSYIRHASETLALRESELILQSANFLHSLAAHHDKSLTEPSTEGSFDLRNNPHEPLLSPKAAERRAFMRKSKRGCERPTQHSREEALQEVKEVCSESTIAVIEALIGEYRLMVEDIARSGFRETFSRKKCEHCLTRTQEPLPEPTELEQKLKKVSGELREAQSKNEELSQQLRQKRSELEKAKGERMIEQALKAYLSEKEEATATRLREVKLVEREILIALENVGQAPGCDRCRSVRAVKAQLLEFRTHLERQGEQLERQYQLLKRRLRGGQ